MKRNRTRMTVSDECVIACETPQSESDQLKMFKAMCAYALYGEEPKLGSDELHYLFETAIREPVDVLTRCKLVPVDMAAESPHRRGDTRALDALIADRLEGTS